MPSNDYYRARAIECIKAADAAASLERKSAFLELAQRWLDLASRIEAMSLRGNVLLCQSRQTRH